MSTLVSDRNAVRIKYNSIRNFSFSISLIFHLIVFGLLLLVKFSVDYPEEQPVEVSFGNTGMPGSSGALGNQLDNIAQLAKQNDEKDSKDKSEELKNTWVPKALNPSGEDVINQADKKKDKSGKKNNSNLAVNSNINAEGRGNQTNGTGSFGYGIDWGGQGQRKIYSYFVPAYPEGVEKEIDIRLKFTIMPDGTVGNIIPLIKADTRLESSAINSLRQWRFEPLAPGQKQIEQAAVIVFPYRLR
ncbi:MAG: energy transducer TonB [Ignavibacteriaceae bacterium]|jgi:protein TonB